MMKTLKGILQKVTKVTKALMKTERQEIFTGGNRANREGNGDGGGTATKETKLTEVWRFVTVAVAVVLLVGTVRGAIPALQTVSTVQSNGVLYGPTNFFASNSAAIKAALDNGSVLTNNPPQVQDVLAIVSDSRWDVEGTPGWDTWTQVLKQDPRFSGKYSIIDMAKSGDSFAGDLGKIGTFALVATNAFPANVRKTVLIMLYVNDSASPVSTTEANALTFYNFWHTNGWRVIAGTDPGPIATAGLVTFNTWLRAGVANVDYLWDLATNTPLTYADGLHNDVAFAQICYTNFIANVLPQTVSGLRPVSLGGQSIQGTLRIEGNPNYSGQGAMALDAKGMIRLFNNTELAFMGNGVWSNTPLNYIHNDTANTLQFYTFLTKRFEIAQVGWMAFNTNVNYGAYPVYVFSKPDADTFSQQIAGFVDQPGGAWKVLIGTNGMIAQFKGANVSSASTITPSGYITHITGTTTINTINVPYSHFTGSIVLIPDGLWATGTSGNIQIASTAVVSKALLMTYDGSKWYPSY